MCFQYPCEAISSFGNEDFGDEIVALFATVEEITSVYMFYSHAKMVFSLSIRS